MVKIKAISALNDNYIWVLINTEQQAIVVDPGEAEPVLEFLAQENLQLMAVLATHKHGDHTHGIKGLLKKFPSASVYGAAKDQVPLITHDVVEGQVIKIAHFPDIKVLEIPGHTEGHVAYLIANNLFCGDTLFSAGCGRVFSGTYEQMFASLQKIAALPSNTQIYCGHEYTLANLKFASAVEPHNQVIIEHIGLCESLRAKGLPTLPSNLALEQQINPFLRWDALDVKQNVRDYLGHSPANAFEVFKALREWKNNF